MEIINDVVKIGVVGVSRIPYKVGRSVGLVAAYRGRNVIYPLARQYSCILGQC